jgi:hypothetical protein
MVIGHLRVLLLVTFVVTAFFCQTRLTGAQSAEVSNESLDFSGCFPDHQFEVCAEISGVRHQIVTSSGVTITGFTEFSCFTVTLFGEFVSQRCQTEHNAGMTIDGFLTSAHDSGYMEFTEGGQTCAGRFLLQIANGELIVDESDIECV